MPFRSLIDVRPPYYALAGASLREPGYVTCQVRREHPLGHELGPLAAAEAGRHLAILGACACSSIRAPASTHYYLAQRARLTRAPDVASAPTALFEASARAVASAGREARAQGVLRAAGSGEPLFELDVSYKVIAQPTFQRVFAAHRRDLRAMPRAAEHQDGSHYAVLRKNPYRNLLPLELTQRTAEAVRARLPCVSAELCAGHFPLYPALPVAVLMHSLSTLCGEALRARWGDAACYRVLSADVQAERLAFAGEQLVFGAEFKHAQDAREWYAAEARLLDGTLIGCMSLELEPESRNAS